MTTVYLIDDHHALREAMATTLEAESDITVVGQCGDANQGVEEVRQLQPNVVVLDLKLQNASGMSAIPELLAAHPGTRILIFTMYDNAGYVWGTMNAGASGYVLKSASHSELLRAVRAVASGSGFLQAEVTMPLLKRLAREARDNDSRSALSIREMHIVEALAAGQSNKVIARSLSIGEETVKSHLKKVYEKLGASDRAHAVAIALRQRLIE